MPKGRPAWRGPPFRGGSVLLDRHSGAGALEGLLGLVRGLLVGLLQDRLRRAVDEVLGLLQAQAGQLTDDLDDLDLLVTGTVEDDVELVLLRRLLSPRSAAARGGRRSNSDRSRGGDAEGLLELLHELRQLDQRHLLERIEQVVGSDLRHSGSSLVSQLVDVASPWSSGLGATSVSEGMSVTSAAAWAAAPSSPAASAADGCVASSAASAAGGVSSTPGVPSDG